MNLILRQKIAAESIWWIVTLLICMLVLGPICQRIPDFPFFTTNVLFIITFVTLTRYMFFMKHAFFNPYIWLKLLLIAPIAGLIVVLIYRFNAFTLFMEEFGIQELLSHLSHNEFVWMAAFIRTEMVFFGVGAILSAFLFPFALIRSVWIQYNFKNR